MGGCGCGAGRADALQRRTLWLLLLLNLSMFVIELGAGIAAESTGLIADAMDMLADTAVYGIALYAVGRGAALKRRAARFSGLCQIVLALLVLSDVARRALAGSEPASALMLAVGLLALLVNLGCLRLLAAHRRGEIHMRASWIFSRNDVIANLGVIAAGGLVALSGSNLPDLLIGALIAVVIGRGGMAIIRDSRRAAA